MKENEKVYCIDCKFCEGVTRTVQDFGSDRGMVHSTAGQPLSCHYNSSQYKEERHFSGALRCGTGDITPAFPKVHAHDWCSKGEKEE